jgi:hypothetical protein
LGLFTEPTATGDSSPIAGTGESLTGFAWLPLFVNGDRNGVRVGDDDNDSLLGGFGQKRLDSRSDALPPGGHSDVQNGPDNSQLSGGMFEPNDLSFENITLFDAINIDAAINPVKLANTDLSVAGADFTAVPEARTDLASEVCDGESGSIS